MRPAAVCALQVCRPSVRAGKVAAGKGLFLDGGSGSCACPGVPRPVARTRVGRLIRLLPLQHLLHVSERIRLTNAGRSRSGWRVNLHGEHS